MNRRVLVTGASGFLGSQCLMRLTGRQDIELHAVNRSGAGASAAGVRWHAADLRHDETCRRLIEAVRPTHLLHMAWVATPGVYLGSPENLAWLASSIALFDAFGAAGGQRLVGAGTSAEYLPGLSRCLEDETPLAPASIYGKCKLAASYALGAAAEVHGFAQAWGRIFLPYGPGDPPQRLVPMLMSRLGRGEEVAMSDGRQLRDFIWAPDAAELLVALLFAECRGAFNIGTGTGTSVRSVAEHVANLVGSADRLRLGALPMRPGEPLHLVADMTKVERELNWRAPTSVAVGITNLAAEFGR